MLRKKKVDESGVITRNKARLVAKGYNQEEGIYTMMKPLHQWPDWKL